MTNEEIVSEDGAIAPSCASSCLTALTHGVGHVLNLCERDLRLSPRRANWLTSSKE